jgi:hypothetical protein
MLLGVLDETNYSNQIINKLLVNTIICSTIKRDILVIKLGLVKDHKFGSYKFELTYSARIISSLVYIYIYMYKNRFYKSKYEH